MGTWLAFSSSLASIISLPVAILTLFLADSLNFHVNRRSFSKRAVSILGEMREAERIQSRDGIIGQIEVLESAIRNSFPAHRRYLDVGIRDLMKALKKESQSSHPKILVVQGLLLNIKKKSY